MEEIVPKPGDRFDYIYRSVQTTFRVVRRDEPFKWLCQATDGRFRGLMAVFDEEQLLMLVAIYNLAGAEVV